MGLILLLPGPDGLGAGEVAGALRRLGHDVVILTALALEGSTWEHRIDAAGVCTRLTPPGRSAISHTEVGAVLNRLSAPSLARFARSDPRDRDYAAAEWQALLMSWLEGLGDRVIGRVDGQGLRSLHAGLSWWQWAHWCGLDAGGVITIPTPLVDPVAPQPHRGDLVRFVLVGDRVLHWTGDQWEDSVGRTAAAVRALGVAGDADLLGVDLCVSPDAMSLVGVDPRPALRDEVAVAVAELLHARARRPVRLVS